MELLSLLFLWCCFSAIFGSCKKEPNYVNQLIGTYHGEQKNGNSTSFTEINILRNGEEENQFLIDHIYLWYHLTAAEVSSPNTFIIPWQVITFPSTTGGGGVNWAPTSPYILKYGGHGIFSDNTMYIEIEEYRKYPDDTNFYFTYLTTLNLTKE